MESLTSRSTVSELIGRYLLKASTRASARTMKCSIAPSTKTLGLFMGSLALGAVVFERADAYDTFLRSTFKQNTARHKFILASGVFSYGVKLGAITKNPFLEIAPPEYEFTGRNLDSATIRDLIALLPPLYHSVCWLGLYTGMRRNEAVYLDWAEVRDDSIVLPARRTKAGKERPIPIGGEAWAILPLRQASGRVYSFSHDQLNYNLRKAWGELGEGRIRFHDFRGTAATKFFELSRDTEAGLQIFGWKSEISAKPYQHMTAARLAPMRDIRY
jgi:integrase